MDQALDSKVGEDRRLVVFKVFSILLGPRGGEGPYMLVGSLTHGFDEIGIQFMDFDPSSVKILNMTIDSGFKCGPVKKQGKSNVDPTNPMSYFILINDYLQLFSKGYNGRIFRFTVTEKGCSEARK